MEIVGVSNGRAEPTCLSNLTGIRLIQVLLRKSLIVCGLAVGAAVLGAIATVPVRSLPETTSGTVKG
jgi:hypothetical protein